MEWSVEHGYIFVPNPFGGGYISIDAWVLVLLGFVLVGVTALIVSRASVAKRVTRDE